MTNLVRPVILALSAVACIGCGKPAPTPVIGVEGMSLHADDQLGKGKASVTPGTELTIMSEKDDALEVKTSSGDQGWVRRCWICSSDEFQRRKAANEIPKQVICLGSRDGNTVMYGGSLSIRNGETVMEPGDAFWMDDTMKGKQFTFGSNAVTGDPSILLLTPEDGDMIRLKIWQTPSTTN